MIKNFFYLTVFVLIIFSACKSDSPVTPTTENTNYTHILNSRLGDTRFELWSASGTSLMTGYNDIGFKVYLSGTKMNSGNVKFYPKNYSSVGLKSCPVSPSFNYDASKELFTGYVNFFASSDTGAVYWGGQLFYNGNNINTNDTIAFDVHINHLAQVIMFNDNINNVNVYMTLMQPMTPKQNLNDFNVMVHKSNDGVFFYEADSLEMFIKPWMQLMGHSSSENVNPAGSGSGVYKGKVNLSMSGEWFVYDSLKFNNNFITPTPAPKFILECP